MSNLGLEHALGELGVGFRRAPVGDRYIMEMLQENGWGLGGETSGHIICLDRTTTGDGIVSALQVLEEIRRTGRSLHELKGGMSKFPQVLVNVRLGRRVDREALAPIEPAVRAVEARLAGRGRVLLRPSGTEPLIRVMVEGQDEGQVNQLARQLAAEVERQFAGSEE
jgi:phosphoglucosamine mutase